jgi:hypothetical protein
MDSTLGSSTRIAALRTAMKNFYTTVKTATTGSNSRIRYGFVPFSSSVNVGRLLMDKDPGYIADSYDVQSREQVKKWVNSTKTESENKNDVIGPQTPEATAYDSQNSCKSGMVTITTVKNGVQQTYPPNTLTSNDDQVVTTQTTVQPWKETSRVCLKNSGNNKWYRNATERTYDVYTYTTTTSNHVFDYWSWKLLTYDVSSYKSFQSVTTQTGTKGTDVTSTWKGCIEERDTVAEPTFSYSTITGITPSGANDLDIDTPPSSDDDDTKWKPMWPEVAFRRNASNYVSSACPYQARLLNEMTQSEFNSYADSLYPEGSTYLDVGMTWGGRLASPQGIFKDNVTLPPSNGGEVSRHIIFMSDGDMDPNQTSQSAWGIEELDRRVTIDGTDSQDKSRHTSRFQVICAAIKAKGIRVWTISFTTGTSSVLTTCASPKSAFNADNAAELNAAFQEIAKQVGELRLTQ